MEINQFIIVALARSNNRFSLFKTQALIYYNFKQG